MTSEQWLEDKDTIIRTLEAAGWSRTSGGATMDLAILFYDNGSITLRAEQDDDDDERELILELTKPDGTLVLYADHGEGNNLDALLKALVGSQDDITGENFQDHVRRWLQACPDIYYQEDEDADPQRLDPG
jgi:hypothetical protein